MKFLIILALPALVLCNFEKLKTSKIDELPAFFVGQLIKDFNSKSKGSDLVLLLDIGERSDLTKNILSTIREENVVIALSLGNCELLNRGKAEFVVILSDASVSFSESKQKESILIR